MNVIVCVNEVPNPCLPVEFDMEKGSIRDEDWTYVLNPYDEVALEEAVRIKERTGGNVTAITVGPQRAEKSLRRCLALGADEAIHLCDNAFSDSDAYATAFVLAKAISQIRYDLILCGFQSVDWSGGEVGIMLSEFLGLPAVSAITKLDVTTDMKNAIVLRRLERGNKEQIRCPLPAVFTVEMSLNEPRYPTYPAFKQSLRENIVRHDLKSLDLQLEQVGQRGSLTRVLSISKRRPKRLFVPPADLPPAERLKLLMSKTVSEKKTNLVEGPPEEVVKEIAEFLGNL